MLFKVNPLAQFTYHLTKKLPAKFISVGPYHEIDYRTALANPVRKDAWRMPPVTQTTDDQERVQVSLVNGLGVSWAQAQWARTKAYATAGLEIAKAGIKKIKRLFQRDLSQEKSIEKLSEGIDNIEGSDQHLLAFYAKIFQNHNFRHIRSVDIQVILERIKESLRIPNLSKAEAEKAVDALKLEDKNKQFLRGQLQGYFATNPQIDKAGFSIMVYQTNLGVKVQEIQRKITEHYAPKEDKPKA